MGPVNNILNSINALNSPNISFVRRETQSRITNLFVTTPTEIAQVAKNILLTPFHAAGAALKAVTHVTILATGSKTLKKLDEKLPGFKDLLRTISNVFAYAIGAFLSSTIGILYPNANYKLHCALGLAVNPKQEISSLQPEEDDMELIEALANNEELTVEEQELFNNLSAAFAAFQEIERKMKELDETTNLESKIEKTEEFLATFKSLSETNPAINSQGLDSNLAKAEEAIQNAKSYTQSTQFVAAAG